MLAPSFCCCCCCLFGVCVCGSGMAVGEGRMVVMEV